MAGNTPTELPVEIDADGQGIFNVFRQVEANLGEINKLVGKIGATADKSAMDFKKQIEGATKGLKDQMSAISTLSKAQNTPGFNIQNLNNQRGLANQTKQAGDFARSLDMARNSAEALKGKINDLNRDIAARGQGGQTATIEQRDRLALYEKQLLALKALDAQQERNQRRISSTGGGGLTAELKAYEAAQARLQSAALNPRRSNLTTEINQARLAQDQLTEAINRSRTAEASLMREQRSQRLALAGRDARSAAIGSGGTSSARAGFGFDRQLAENRLASATGADVAPAREALQLAEARLRAIDAIIRSEQLEINQLQRRNELEANANARLGGKSQREYQLGEAQKVRDIAEIEQRRISIAARIATLRQEGVTKTGEEARLLHEELQTLQAIERQLRKNLTEINAETRAQEKLDAAARGPAPAKPGSILPSGGLPTVFARTAAYAAAGSLLFGLVSTLKEGAQFTVEFEDKLKTLQAVANATDSEMVGLKASIEAVGENSRYSLVDLTEMATKLAQAGVSAGTMGQALSSVATLATASGSTTGESVDLITAALGAFQLQANETPRVADLMTSALNRTRLTVNQAALAIQYVGATAQEQNISLEQLLATAAALSQAGIRSGSTIGTGMRQFLVDLQAPSEKLTDQLTRLGIKSSEVDVATRGLPAVLETLKDKGFGAASAYAGLETRAAAFYLVARNNTGLMADLQIQMAEAGAAAQANERAMNSLAAQWQRFKNIIGEGFASSMDDTMMGFKNLLKHISDGIEEGRKLAAQADERRAGGYQSYVKQAGGNQVDAFVNYQNENFIPNAIKDVGVLSTAILNMLDGNSYRGRKGWGDRWAEYTAGVADATDSTDRLTGKLHGQQEVVAEHTTKMSALDQEMARLQLQQKGIEGTAKGVNVETVNLTGRFEGLSSMLGGTVNGVQDLIGAMQRLKNQEGGLLVEQLNGVIATGNQQIAAGVAGRTQAIARLKGNPAIYNLLNSQEKKDLNTLGSSNATPEQRSIASSNLTDRQGIWSREKRTDAAAALDSIIRTNSATASGRTTVSMAQTQRGNALQDATPVGQSMQGVSRVVEGLIQQMRTADKEDRGGLAGQIESSLKPLEGAMRANIASTGADRNPHQVEFLKQLDSYRTQYKGIMMPSKEELAQAKRDAATAARGERTAERNDQRPLVTRQDLIDVTKSIFGDRVRVGSGYRSQAQQDAIHSRTKAKVSAHTDSLAQDFPTGPVSDAVGKQMALQLENTLKQRGIPTKLVQYENGKNGNGTGPHIHVGLAKGTRYASGSDKDGTLTSGRIDLSNENLAVKNADKELKSTFSDLKLATSEAVFKEGTTAAEAAFEKWKQALITQVDQEIATSGGMSDGQQAERKAERDAQIKAKRDELDSAVFDGILKNFDAQKKAIDKAFNEKTRASREGVTRAQSTIEGFGYYSNRNRIPDYVQTLAANRLGRAQESAARDKLNKLPETIKDSQALLSQMNATLSHTENKAEAETLKVKIDELTASIKDLRAEKEALDQSFGAGDLVPKTVREGLDQAITAYRETHNLTNSFSQDLIDNMGGALTTVHEGLTTMFGDILSGSTSVLAAFGNFVQGMIKFMIQLAAKALATKVFDLILSTIGSAAGGKISASSAPLGPPITVAFEGGGNIGGGWVPGLLGGGGRVTQGSATRDSVRAMIAKDEWVVNKKATDSVGHDFMRRLNSQGAAALDAMRGSPIILPQGKNETNVYVVKPNERPQLGKNDILLVVHEDILANGETKKLIHHVSQGG